jgi:hypothetical protein
MSKEIETKDALYMRMAKFRMSGIPEEKKLFNDWYISNIMPFKVEADLFKQYSIREKARQKAIKDFYY